MPAHPGAPRLLWMREVRGSRGGGLVTAYLRRDARNPTPTLQGDPGGPAQDREQHPNRAAGRLVDPACRARAMGSVGGGPHAGGGR